MYSKQLLEAPRKEYLASAFALGAPRCTEIAKKPLRWLIEFTPGIRILNSNNDTLPSTIQARAVSDVDDKIART